MHFLILSSLQIYINHQGLHLIDSLFIRHENTHVNSDSTKCHQCQQKTPVCLYLHITMKHAIYNMYNAIFITDSPENAFDTHKPVENSKLLFPAFCTTIILLI